MTKYFYRPMGSSSQMLWTDVYGDNGHRVSWLFNIFEYFHDGYRWVRNRVNPRYQHHIVHTGLTPGWHDIDEVMLHANFSLLTRYVEWEKGGVEEIQEHIDYLLSEQADLDYNGLVMSDFATNDIEALALYEWWMVERPQLQARLDQMREERYSVIETTFRPVDRDLNEVDDNDAEFFEMVFKGEENAPHSIEELAAMEDKLREQDTDNLIRLIRIRGSLWD
jgi:hypothetical protein